MASRESVPAMKKRAARVSAALAKLYPKARISLDFATPWQCLAATILSAQCTDERVNQVTPALFREFPDARATAGADPERIQKLIVTTGFFRQKTKSLITSAKMIVERHGGEVPSKMDDLVKLSGVGRKTANVILGHVHGKPICHARQPRCAECAIVEDCPQIGVVKSAAKSTTKTARVAKKARTTR